MPAGDFTSFVKISDASLIENPAKSGRLQLFHPTYHTRTRCDTLDSHCVALVSPLIRIVLVMSPK